ncbi:MULTISPECIES: ribosome biogenesis GTP-binding protein YihA/YsxC [unclassified Anaerobiospirillum]|uniref:ribosome biogenesis GTP-binding protein YihA/YsxC n=1 Tax=unclassified Anaerobiospirillum TaxID=2647410 RepID=UPI001FF53246|nr:MULTISPECIES: ribosome biogenesis GTP-binding protein YihA/YsxC [unclassified Anaerobiospirillum]MCK0525542.1 ribosome biogenesis GTP-binding protein YihA/YsxC [Anaerobiospirillum sp. NML120449]MCK0535375.1 ribosome biogenesis GTP-binding protein YihA/YsxC [Anaerobiospirillum sp. NML120511]MCK0539067.1 ribosome biogenesis GTP-binding protein YihA/YsxC [Anaerobiospirillum sp. NML02-A-032]
MSTPGIDFRQTRFITSAPDLHRLPDDLGAEIAFAGRSNSGKSSSLNAICDQNHLAKTSRTPGRTRLINLFEVKKGCSLVDLPGYGYAAVPESMKRQWQKSMSEYLQKRKALRGIVVTMDIRHPLKDHDRLIIDWSLAANLPALILLTKADKLGVNKRREAVKEVKDMLSEFGGNFTVIAFSAWNKIGLDEVRSILSGWFTTFHGVEADDYDPADGE